MKFALFVLIIALAGLSTTSDAIAQEKTVNVAPSPAPQKKVSEILSQNLEKMPGIEIPRERREASYAKLLEGQKYLWELRRVRTSVEISALAGKARAALQKSVELDPTLAEAYTALAELATLVSTADIEEAILLANIAAKLSPDNFGARRLLARLYTVKSGIAESRLDLVSVEKAISEWKSVARLDPRNAEAWAFLSEFYGATKKPEAKLDALQRWLASAAPVDTGFYRRVFGNNRDLAPDSALPKLGLALTSTGKTQEGIEILCRTLLERPDDRESLALLRGVLQSNEKLITPAVLESLQRLVYSNARDSDLVRLFVDTHRRAGKVDQAVSFLSAQIARQTTDNETSSNLYLVLGEMLFEAGRVDEANAAFEALLKLNGIKTDPITTEDQRELAAIIFEKMISLFKESGRIEDAKSVINRARIVFGEDDQFSGRALISLFRETNQRPDALREVRSLRSRFPQDTSLLRLEAQLLNEVGKVVEAVALIEGENARIGIKDDLENAMAYFSNQIFVTSLYVEAKRGKLALASAKKALLLAKGNEQELTAKFSLATAAHEANDYSTSESALREVLAKSPRNPIALNNLGYFLADRGVRLDEAFILISDALKIDPMNPNYLDSLGWVNFKRGNLVDAEINLMEAIRVDKTSGTTHEHLGDVFSQNGKLAQALSAWKTAISLLWHPTDINRIKSKIVNAEKKK